jgi:hypothetical protein
MFALWYYCPKKERGSIDEAPPLKTAFTQKIKKSFLIFYCFTNR